jgi:(2Fe-2S) ferredoxin
MWAKCAVCLFALFAHQAAAFLSSPAEILNPGSNHYLSLRGCRRWYAPDVCMASAATESITAQTSSVVLVCTGDACEDVGARDLIKLARKKATESVKCKSTGCLGMCGQGPAIAVQNSEGGALEIHRDVDEQKLDTIFLKLQS